MSSDCCEHVVMAANSCLDAATKALRKETSRSVIVFAGFKTLNRFIGRDAAPGCMFHADGDRLGRQR